MDRVEKNNKTKRRKIMTVLEREIPAGELLNINEVKVQASIFESYKDIKPKLVEDTLPNLFTPHVVRELKDGPAISSAIFTSDANRSAENVSTLGKLLIYDFDKLTYEQFCELNTKSSGLARVCYTTHSFDGDKDNINARLILIANREIKTSEYGDIMHRVDHMLGEHCDSSCNNIGRLFYLASAPQGKLPHAIYSIQDGATVDVDKILILAPFSFFKRVKK